jgi:UDP-galactopyranose mutase
MRFDCVIVGAGFAGAVCAERLANQHRKNVLVVEKRDHIGGNACDCHDAHGILVHRYGPHIFHTRKEEVWRYLSRFTAWRPYQHRVLGCVEGKLVPLPFNLDSLAALFPSAFASRAEGKLLHRFGPGARVPMLALRREEDGDLRALGEFVYEKVFLNYTQKQWGMKPEQLSPSVTARVPVVVSRDDRYFDDPWQGIPLPSYTSLFERLLAGDRIDIMLNTSYREVAKESKTRMLIFTGMIDAFFDYRYGALPYRSLQLHNSNIAVDSYQEAATINYPNEHPYTRITEHKKLTGQAAPTTTISTEFPRPYAGEGDEPYYPIPQEANRSLYERYLQDAIQLANVRFLGRLGQYAYLNMDECVAAALRCAEEVAASL